MKENKIDIKAESFPWQVKMIGALFLFAALMVVMNYWWLSMILAVAGLTLLSGYSGTEIDLVSKTLREYTSFLFFRKGATEKYDQIEKVYINQAKVSQKFYTAHTTTSGTVRYVLYNAYLKVDDNKKIFLTSRKDKTKLIALLNPAVAKLGVPLTDNTVQQ